MKTVPHVFLPTQTINAVIKLKNRHDVTATELTELMAVFNAVNGEKVPRVGQRFEIPILERHSQA